MVDAVGFEAVKLAGIVGSSVSGAVVVSVAEVLREDSLPEASFAKSVNV